MLYSVKFPLLRPLDLKAGQLLRPLDIKAGPLLRPLDIKAGQLLRPLDIKAGQLLRPLDIKAVQLLRPLDIKAYIYSLYDHRCSFSKILMLSYVDLAINTNSLLRPLIVDPECHISRTSRFILSINESNTTTIMHTTKNIITFKQGVVHVGFLSTVTFH